MATVETVLLKDKEIKITRVILILLAILKDRPKETIIILLRNLHYQVPIILLLIKVIHYLIIHKSLKLIT